MLNDDADFDNATDEEISAWVDSLRPEYNRDPKFLAKWAKKVKPLQKDSYYLSWLGMIEPRMDLEFISGDVRFRSCDPYSREGLAVAEEQFLNYYPSLESVWKNVDEPTRRRSGRFVMYLGETFRKNFDIRWVNVPYEGLKHGKPFNVGPWGIDCLDNFWTMLTATAYRRTGTEWTLLWDGAVDQYNWWKEDGTPPVWEEPSCRIFD